MKIFNEAGKDHEEFKLRLNKDQTVELAEINIRREIAEQQAHIVAEALKASKIEIIGGENEFFHRLVNAVTTGKSIDRVVDNSHTLRDVKKTFFGPGGNGSHENFRSQLRDFVGQFNLSSEDLKNLTVSALMMKLATQADGEKKGVLDTLLKGAESLGLGNRHAGEFIDGGRASAAS